ncbi:unnamed protein product [Cyclocybe aegerita]|uniref:MYND-type domain-containing protein n=1 Tax=Cyclocybe aegerita TaxID=1973307 RepID=A0A8S0WI73_CYCAE|nr:unnamed protein product [Cyclocybe aegerita]
MTRRVATFLEILKISPWIAGYVQELHLWVSNTEGEAYGEDIGFLRVMSLLTEARTGSGLQRLTLRGAYYGLAFKDSLALVKNLLRPYISPFITSLCITRLKNIPIAFVAECTHLESLSLHDLQSTMDEDLSLSHPPNARPPSIKTLEVINSDQFLKALLAGQASACAPCIDSSQLRRITSKPASRSDFQESIQAIINEAGNSLEEMEFTPKHGHCNELVYVPLHNLFDFSNSAGLKNLTIDVKVGSPEEVDPIAGLVTILKTIPTDNRVARMKFRLYLGFNTVYHPDRCLELNWRSLDLEIARISSGRPLRLQLEVWYQEFIREEQTEDEDGEAPAEPSSDDENLDIERPDFQSGNESVVRVKLEDLGRERWWPKGADGYTREKLMRRIMCDGPNLLPMVLSIAICLVTEIYSATAIRASAIPRWQTQHCRVRLSMRCLPISDFGIVKGTLPVPDEFRLAYHHESNGALLYCSKECQKSHWKVHKKDCKSPLSEKAWVPGWTTEKRTPAFVTDDNGPMVTQHGLNKFLWGNTPAFDHVQLLRNEGEKWDQPLALCFAASGDLRNVVTSINSLPESYQLPCSIVVNDFETCIVLRNLLLLFTFVSFPPDEAAEMALHLWYSPKLPSKMVACLRPIFNEKLEKIFTHLANHPSSPPETLLKAKFELTDKTSVVALLPKSFWVEMRQILDSKTTSQQAGHHRHMVTLCPERRDYRDRNFCLLNPYHRVAKAKYYEDGLIVPFGGVDRSLFVEPNLYVGLNIDLWYHWLKWLHASTLFDPVLGWWMQNDSQDPMTCWPYDELQSSSKKYSLPSNDIYGALYFHLLAQFRLFASMLGKRELHFTLLGEDARRIPTTLPKLLKNISPQKFDRVDVSNTSDICYIGIEGTLSILGDLLKPCKQNPHATLITLFLNYVMEASIPVETQRRTMRQNMKTIVSLLNADGEVGPPKNECDTATMKSITWQRYIEDRQNQWKKYSEMCRFDAISRQVGMKERVGRTIIEKMPYCVNKDKRINDVLKGVKRLSLTGLNGHECYIEWMRTR